ncbi:SAM-dependent methyltransferase [Streptomyces sp. NPDC059913]|uniref:SAM-dependent methyltransferase n=1 Tax=unclassified Streptomyces TaxID=2593676 RepID=UPI003650561A
MLRVGSRRESDIPINFTTPNQARMYDHFTGGSDGYPADHAACEELQRIAPGIREGAQMSRAFLRRAVAFLARDRGVRRFIDHGSGLPARPYLHTIAAEHHDEVRALYIDDDPMVHAHGRTMLAGHPGAQVLRRDLRCIDGVYRSAEASWVLEGEEPVAALFVSVLHTLETDAPEQILRTAVQFLPQGSYVVIAQPTCEDPEVGRKVDTFMREATGSWGRLTNRNGVVGFFAGLDDVVGPPAALESWLLDPTESIPEIGTAVTGRMKRQPIVEFGGLAQIPAGGDPD